jgi:uncharacterized protein YjbJ (UPF0337 family)
MPPFAFRSSTRLNSCIVGESPPAAHRKGGTTMGFVEKAKNAAEDAIGQVKETVGDVTGNDDLKAEGKKDQGVSGAKKVGENIKDKFTS